MDIHILIEHIFHHFHKEILSEKFELNFVKVLHKYLLSIPDDKYIDPVD